MIALHYSGTEDLSPIAQSGGARIMWLLLLKGMADNVLSDTLWAKAVMLTSPAAATVGLSLTVPLAMASELLLPSRWMVDAAPPTPLQVRNSASVVHVNPTC